MLAGVLNGFLTIVQGIVGPYRSNTNRRLGSSLGVGKTDCIWRGIGGNESPDCAGRYNQYAAVMAFSSVTSILSSIRDLFVSIFTNIVSAVTGKVTAIKNAVVNGLTSGYHLD